MVTTISPSTSPIQCSDSAFTCEVFMASIIVCPFYGKSDDKCDVGCGYISPYDVNQIIRYCSRCYRDCLKYRELASSLPGEVHDLVKC